MSEPIINWNEWLETPAGQYLLAWEQAQIDAAVTDIFGYHALQLGLAQLNGLHGNRMPHQWLALDSLGQVKQPMARPVALLCDYAALPFASSSLDLLVLPHTLEFSPDPHATLREVERVLVPEGRVVVCGLNPLSLWGFRQGRARLYQRLGRGKLFLPDGGQFIAAWRLRDWLRLLSLEVEHDVFGCYRPALQSDKWLQRFAWMEQPGVRWWPIFGAAYFMVAVKRVRGMRLLEPVWKAKPVRTVKPVSVARKQGECSQWEKQE
ncbi:MAG: methyltransferase domain-containing protein [Rhodoferax sp.]|nr:methyltransferase domain-containing protein [Rhodoferax sp.]